MTRILESQNIGISDFLKLMHFKLVYKILSQNSTICSYCFRVIEGKKNKKVEWPH